MFTETTDWFWCGLAVLGFGRAGCCSELDVHQWLPCLVTLCCLDRLGAVVFSAGAQPLAHYLPWPYIWFKHPCHGIHSEKCMFCCLNVNFGIGYIADFSTNGSSLADYVSLCFFVLWHAVPTGVKDGAGEGGHLKGPTFGELVKEPRIDSSALMMERPRGLAGLLACNLSVDRGEIWQTSEIDEWPYHTITYNSHSEHMWSAKAWPLCISCWTSRATQFSAENMSPCRILYSGFPVSWSSGIATDVFWSYMWMSYTHHTESYTCTLVHGHMHT